jgi:zeaxanthin glucosyltransferase
MTYFGIICLEATGHLNTMFPLGRELQRRGHAVTIISTPGAQSKAVETGFNFRVIGEKEYSCISKTKTLTGISALRQTFDWMKHKTEIGLRDIPPVVKELGIEALLVDLSVFEGGTVADSLNLPFATICCMLPFYQDDILPPIPTTWQYNPAWWARLRNRTAYSLFDRMSQPVWKVLSEYRQQSNLPAYSNTNDLFSKNAIITRHLREFEFPCHNFPPHFYFTGPFHESTGRQKVDFPF